MDFSSIVDLFYLVAITGAGAIVAELLMQYMGQRSIEHQISIGIQGIMGINNMQTIDRAMERSNSNSKKE